jgi:predicted signal transduction protein with EAL and GGDEF domain
VACSAEHLYPHKLPLPIGRFAHCKRGESRLTEKALRIPRNGCACCSRGAELTINQEAEIVLDDLDGSIRLVGIAQDITVLRTVERRIKEMAYLDSLTGLPNRAFLHRFLGIALAGARRNRQRLAVLALDLDLFKRVNDTLGHAAGDSLLKEVARRLRGCLRRSDAAAHSVRGQVDPEPNSASDEVASRLGGDEFVVVLNQLSGVDDAVVVARRIAERLAEPFVIDGRDVSVSSSIGIATFPDDGEDIDALLQCADAAMYHAKANGRNNYQFFSSQIQERARRRVELEVGLRALLDGRVSPETAGPHGALVLHYQPVLAVPDLHVTGVEALVRWARPPGGLVPPGEFIGIAEDCGLIVPLGDWVLRTACRQAAKWRAAGRPLRVAVNVSAKQL